MELERRDFLRNASLGAAAAIAAPVIVTPAAAQAPALPEIGGRQSPVDPADEEYWGAVRRYFKVTGEAINLENGYFGIQPLPVIEAYQSFVTLTNEETAYFMRRKYGALHADVVKDLARFSGADPAELLITRNATEAMNILIQGYALKEGDEVVLHRQDYDSMIETFEMLAKRKGVKLVYIPFPYHPESDEALVAAYDKAIGPRTRLVLLTHMLHRTGHILPVRKIADMARARGVDVMVDAAHSFAQIDFKLPDLGADFVGANLHKWLGAPLGVGLLYVRRARVKDIAPLFGDITFKDDDIRKLGHFGTTPAAPILAIPHAVAFQERVGSRNKEARLRFLKDRWTSKVKDFRNVELLTPAAPERACAMAAFRVKGMEAKDVVAMLLEQHRIFTVQRVLEDGNCVRVTPQLYNTVEDMDRLAAALARFA